MITLNSETKLGTLIENRFGDKYLFSVNRNQVAEIDYETVFKQNYADVFEKEDAMHVITGTDSGMLVKHILKNKIPSGSSFVFIEFPEIIELTKHQYNLSNSPRVIVTTEDRWQEEATKIGMQTYFTIARVALTKSLASQFYYLNEYLYLHNAMQELIRQLAWKLAPSETSDIFYQRQLENLAENHTPAIVLKDYFKGKSALILAGGPSLDNYIDWIEKNQEHYVVIAVSRIARRLMNTNIKPDIFVSVDPHFSNYNASKEVFNYSNSSLLVHNYYVSPQLLGNWLGINLYLGDLFPWETSLNKVNLEGIGPTVTNTAIKLAINLGIKEQILFGVDLCNSPEGFTHAKGSTEHFEGPDLTNAEQVVTTNNGEKAETISAYVEAASVLEIQAKLVKAKKGQLINPSPNSAKIQDIEHLSLAQLILPKDKVSINDFLITQRDTLKNNQLKIQHYKNILIELNRSQNLMKKIDAIALQCLDFNEKFYQQGNVKADYKFKVKMDKLEKKLNDQSLVKFSDLAKRLGMKEFLKFITPDKDKEWTDEQVYQSLKTYYKALRTGIKRLDKIVFTAILHVETRQLELDVLKINPALVYRHLSHMDKTTLLEDRQLQNLDDQKLIEEDISKVLSLYKNKTFANTEEQRLQFMAFYMIFLSNFLYANQGRVDILEEVQADFYQLEDDIVLFSHKTPCFSNHYDVDLKQVTIKDYKDDHKIVYDRYKMIRNDDDGVGVQDLTGLEIKLYNKFTLKDKKALEKMINSLQLINKDVEDQDSLLHLAKAYLLELQGAIDEALDEYGFATSELTLESSLKRLVAISLDRGELQFAHDTLSMLGNISPDYLPQLAELYKATKNFSAALDTYTKYLQYNATSTPVLFQMAKIYEQENIKEGAIFIYQEILKIEPGNLTASNRLKTLAS